MRPETLSILRGINYFIYITPSYFLIHLLQPTHYGQRAQPKRSLASETPTSLAPPKKGEQDLINPPPVLYITIISHDHEL